MNLLNKGPDGKFIGSQDALRVWLPTLLYHHCGSDPIEAVLKLCIDRLNRDAAERLRWGQRELAKREVLIEAIKKLRELK